MLKIYNANAISGEIKLQDYIKFKDGHFDTGYEGFGQIKSGNLSCKNASYILQSVEQFKNYLQNIKVIDGYVENFVFYNPYSYEMLNEAFGHVSKNHESYEKNGLNEEGIILFTDYVYLKYKKDGLVQRIYGRCPENSMYLIMPNAAFDMYIASRSSENYEVLQSRSLGKRLVLEKMNRKI